MAIKYYNIAKLLKDCPQCYYYMVIGERSNGKTYSALKYALERYFNHNEQFAYIRRFNTETRRKNLQTLFDSHVQNEVISTLSKGEYTAVDYWTGKFSLVNYYEDEIDRSEDPIGYAFDLNSVEHYKSTSYPRVTTIIFDEFLSRQGYLTNEFVLFMNMLSTIIRDRSNVKIIMLGNTVNKYCPYFQEMGLSHIKDQKQGSVDVYNYADTGLSVAVEYCDPMSNRGGKKSDVYFAFDNPQLQMITGGAWEIAIYPHLEERYAPKDVAGQFFIEFQGDLLHCEIVANEAGYFLFVHPKTTPIKEEDTDIVYCDHASQRWNWRTGIHGTKDKLTAIIARLLYENRVFYSDNETGEILRNFLMWSSQYQSVKGGR